MQSRVDDLVVYPCTELRKWRGGEICIREEVVRDTVTLVLHRETSASPEGREGGGIPEGSPSDADTRIEKGCLLSGKTELLG